jgi:hypothetical protein
MIGGGHFQTIALVSSIRQNITVKAHAQKCVANTQTQQTRFSSWKNSLAGTVAHIYNPNYLGVWDQEDQLEDSPGK